MASIYDEELLLIIGKGAGVNTFVSFVVRF